MSAAETAELDRAKVLVNFEARSRKAAARPKDRPSTGIVEQFDSLVAEEFLISVGNCNHNPAEVEKAFGVTVVDSHHNLTGEKSYGSTKYKKSTTECSHHDCYHERRLFGWRHHVAA